jgi:hypothetical protein
VRAEAGEVQGKKYMLGGAVSRVDEVQGKYEDAQNDLEHLYDSGKLSGAGFRVAIRELDKWLSYELRTAVDLDNQDKEEATA